MAQDRLHFVLQGTFFIFLYHYSDKKNFVTQMLIKRDGKGHVQRAVCDGEGRAPTTFKARSKNMDRYTKSYWSLVSPGVCFWGFLAKASMAPIVLMMILASPHLKVNLILGYMHCFLPFLVGNFSSRFSKVHSA